MVINVGDRAPDLTLTSHLDKKVTLSKYRGKKNVVIAFFPLAWTPV
jgi:peroxiredoxin